MRTKLFLILICVSVYACGQVSPVNIGTSPNDGTGDNLRDAFVKLNANDAYLDAQAQSLDDSLKSVKYLEFDTHENDTSVLILLDGVTKEAKAVKIKLFPADEGIYRQIILSPVNRPLSPPDGTLIVNSAGELEYYDGTQWKTVTTN